MRARARSLVMFSVVFLVVYCFKDQLQLDLSDLWNIATGEEYDAASSEGGRGRAVQQIPRRSNLAVRLQEGRGGEAVSKRLEKQEGGEILGALKRPGGDIDRQKDILLAPKERGVASKAGEFRIVHPFNFPQPTFSLPAPVLLRSRWVKDLQDYLRSVQGKTISVVTSTVEHTDVLLNWLIAAYVKITEPLQNVMVISMDAELHSILVSRGIASLYVHKDMVVSPLADVPRVFSQVHVVRLAVVRLMNHYGYDVINYDCDAIPLKNPQLIFDEYSNTDLIGTFGKGPGILYEKWGVALNTGVMVMRATPSMEELWKEMPFGKTPPITDDQNSINFCLEHMGIKWTNYVKTEKIEDRSEKILGRVPLKGASGGSKFLSVMLMPYTIVCRHICNPEKRDSYYVWHALAIRSERTVANKRKQATVGGAWYLRSNWKEVSDHQPEIQRTEWLRHIATSY